MKRYLLYSLPGWAGVALFWTAMFTGWMERHVIVAGTNVHPVEVFWMLWPFRFAAFILGGALIHTAALTPTVYALNELGVDI